MWDGGGDVKRKFHPVVSGHVLLSLSSCQNCVSCIRKVLQLDGKEGLDRQGRTGSQDAGSPLG